MVDPWKQTPRGQWRHKRSNRRLKAHFTINTKADHEKYVKKLKQPSIALAWVWQVKRQTCIQIKWHMTHRHIFDTIDLLFFNPL